MATQTESPEKCDSEVQANIQLESESIPPLVPAPTIKQEISMPNIPSSMAETPTKKRKLSPVSISCDTSINTASIDVSLPVESTPSGPDDQLSGLVKSAVSLAPEPISDKSVDQMNNEQADLDDEILNSEVYKIYSRNEDHKEAIKQIRQLKTCYSIHPSKKSFPANEDFINACAITLDRLWKFEPHLGDSKFDKIKKFINEDITLLQLTNSDDIVNITTLFKECMTWIRILIPNGYEFWYIANFELGSGLSKWYRVETTKPNHDYRLAQLKVLGIGNETIAKLHYDQYLRKNSIKTDWLDYANNYKFWNRSLLVGSVGQRGCEKGMFYNYLKYIEKLYMCV